jgi:predicted AAA+ superfamily ATPase
MESILRHFRAPKESFFLFGPRGTGKSSWVRGAFPDALWVDLLEPDVHRAYASRPERLRDLVAGNPKRRVVVIDEVQKVPELLGVVHSLREKNRSLRFVLTGSSARKLKRTAVDLLAGRALVRALHPFMASELGDRFRIDSALTIGTLPVVLGSDDPAGALRAYHALYLKEEVQQEGLVRSIGGFARFLEAISFSHGAVLNISNVARECEIERKSVEGYVGILEDLLLGFRVPVFTRRAKRSVAAHPKFFFFDAGVFRSARPSGPLDRGSEIDGAALEGLLAQHLRAWNSYRGDSNVLYYWRTRAGAEVDFVLYGSDGFWAIEVKNSSHVHPQDVRSLAAFRSDYPEATAILLHRGRERLEIDGVMCLPCDEFLRLLHPSRKISARMSEP